jgi:hypothetical protein
MMRRQQSDSDIESELQELHISVPSGDESESRLSDENESRSSDTSESSSSDETEPSCSKSATATSSAAPPKRLSLRPLAVRKRPIAAAPLSAPSKSCEPLSDRSRSAQILLHQFKGFPPSSALAVPSDENRFSLLCRPKSLLSNLGVSVDCAGHGSLAMGGSDIIYDRNTASVPGLHLPLALDMVTDSVKNRLPNILGFACIFCSVILILASFIFVSPPAPIPHKVRNHYQRICFPPPHSSSICQIVLVNQPDSPSLQTSCPETSPSPGAATLLLPCLMSVNLRVTTADGSSVKNQPIIVSESFPTHFFTVDSPFAPVGQTYVRGDGSAGNLQSLSP